MIALFAGRPSAVPSPVRVAEQLAATNCRAHTRAGWLSSAQSSPISLPVRSRARPAAEHQAGARLTQPTDWQTARAVPP
jgi:hypothetical protein